VAWRSRKGGTATSEPRGRGGPGRTQWQFVRCGSSALPHRLPVCPVR